MSGGGGGKKKKRGGEGFHPDERWLLTYADMITLLMALFIILWAMSTTSADKFDALKLSLNQAFGTPLFVGQTSILQGGSGSDAQVEPVTPIDSLVPDQAQRKGAPTDAEKSTAAQAELQDLQKVKEQIDEYTGARGIGGKVQTSIDERGLVIRILPDGMLFQTGEADLLPGARPVLDKLVGAVESVQRTNPVRIEGHTDSVPIATARYRNNWELSTGRAVTVLSVFLDDGVDPTRMTAAGYADTRPIASNDSVEGRAENRRVEIVIVRTATQGAETASVELPADVAGASEEQAATPEEPISPFDENGPIGISPDANPPVVEAPAETPEEVVTP